MLSGGTLATFLLAWRSRHREELRAESALPLLFGVATNVLRNQRRSLKRSREAFARLPLPGPDEPDFAEEAAGRMDDRIAMRLVLTVFARLPRREQDVIALFDWSGLSYEGTASALGIPVGTVRSRLARGRRRLRELAAAGGPEVEAEVVLRPIEVKEP